MPNLFGAILAASTDDTLFGTAEGDILTLNGDFREVRAGAGADLIAVPDFLDLGENFSNPRSVFGEAGDDIVLASTLIGGDLFDGGAGFDVIDWSESEEVGATFDLRAGVAKSANVSFFGAGSNAIVFLQSQMRGFEGLIGTANADKIIGDDAANTLFGGAGDDTVDGRAGDDGIDGGAGDDVLNGGEGEDAILGGEGDDLIRGGAGDDVLAGGSGVNTVSYEDSPSGVSVDLEDGVASDGFGGGDELANFSNVIGSAGDDILTGDAAENRLSGGLGTDELDGGGGSDVMDGGLGNDAYFVDHVGDTLVDDGGIDTVNATIDFDLPGGFENLDFLDSADSPADLDGTGIQLDNLIFGSRGANRIKASGGDDTVIGGDGDDVLNGQSGDDELRGGDGFDFLTGKGGADRLFGGAGNDQLRGEGGDDVLRGGGAKDRLIGKAGNDRLFGGDGNDKLFGNSASDTLFGDAGDDVLTGGEGVDFFVFAPGSQIDVIKDFEIGVDKLNVSAFENLDQILDSMQDKNGRLEIYLDGADDVVRLNGVRAADISASDFQDDN